MTDAAMNNEFPARREPPMRSRGSGNWLALFAMGFAAGIGSVVALTSLNGQGSLTDYLRSDRVEDPIYPIARIPIAVLPSDLGVPPDLADKPDLRTDAFQKKSPGRAARTGNATTVASLESEFANLDYRLADVRARAEDVPRLVPAAVPDDLDNIQEVGRRKAVFFKMVLPLVLIANEQLEADRARIERIHSEIQAGTETRGEDRAWIDRQFKRYKVEAGQYEALLRRVDVVPPSLALAQAAIESGWGTSRLAREGNALFGQWVWGDDADGIVPEQRQDGLNHKIKAFDNPLQAVQAYIKNLNTHRAYRHFREIRANLRTQGAGMNGMTLAEGLESYSEKGRAYIDLLRNIIAVNDLRPLDKAKLRSGGTA